MSHPYLFCGLQRRHFPFEAEVLKRFAHPSLPCVYRAFEDVKQGRAYVLKFTRAFCGYVPGAHKCEPSRSHLCANATAHASSTARAMIPDNMICFVYATRFSCGFGSSS